MLKKIGFYLKVFWYGLFYGMKRVDKLMTGSQKDINDSVFEVTDDGGGGVFNDIFQQKVTQEVEELRYSSYEVAKRSKKYKYVGNGNAIRKNSELTEKHCFVDESDNLRIILIQDNLLICDDVLSTLNEVGNDKNKKIHNDYTLKVQRSIVPRFRIEDYIKKFVLKLSDGNYVIDLYCSKYPGQFSERKDRSFLSELKRIKKGEIRNSDIFDFDKISFITSNAWNVDDWYRFVLNDFELYDIIDFDGNYVIRFGCQSECFMENILDKIYSESAENKYKNKEKKEGATVNIINYQKTDDYEIPDGNILENLENMKFSIENDEKM
jgi:hypothetical protein